MQTCKQRFALLRFSFDGDGMIYACRIKNGKVNFSNRYVDTNRLRQEKAAGHPLGLKVNCFQTCISACTQHHSQGKAEQAPGARSTQHGSV